jgi:hypothetical protein
MTDEPYARLAAEHLPPELAGRWTALLRPCLRLRPASAGEEAAAVLGGLPELPAGAEWPEWVGGGEAAAQGHGALSFVASLRCAALPREGLAQGFPRDGHMLFFRVDDRLGDMEESFVSAAGAATGAGSRVVYVPGGIPILPADPPPGLDPYPRVDLAAEPAQSAPDLWLPQVREVLLGGGPWPQPREIPAEIRPFHRAFQRLRTSVGHQIGGHALPLQGPVEYEVANTEIGGFRPWGDPLLDREAERWTLLAQFDSDSDAGTVWGDTGALYWLIRPDDLAARRFESARLVMQ